VLVTYDSDVYLWQEGKDVDCEEEFDGEVLVSNERKGKTMGLNNGVVFFRVLWEATKCMSRRTITTGKHDDTIE
jgi:hypothetical protein